MSGLLRSNLVVAAGTALSRVTGLLRVFAVAYVLGQEAIHDAYILANETPNIVYDLLLGGVLSATLVPLFTSYMGDDERPTDQRATNVIITTAVTLMLALTALAVVAAPLIFRVYSLDVPEGVDPSVFRDAGTALTRVLLVQILFYGLAGIANAYLHSRRRFFAAAWSPIVSNLVVIFVVLSLPDAGERDWQITEVLTNDRLRWTLGLGATLGIAAMALIAVAAMSAAGLRFRPVWDRKHPAVRKLLTLSGWTFGFVAAHQLAVVVIRNLANREGEGTVTAYFQAFIFFVLPHGLLAVSIATTFQPEMARAVRDRDRAALVGQVTLGARTIALLTLPAAAALFALRDPIAGLMVRGQFTASDAGNTARALAGLTIGLTGFSVYLFVLRAFYAHHDTRTPFVLNVGANVLNIVLGFVLVQRWGVLGLGLAYAIAYVLAAAWALQVLIYKVRGVTWRALMGGMERVLASAVLAGAAMWFITRDIADDAGWRGVVQIAVGGVVGVTVYSALLIALRVPDLDVLRNQLRRAR